MTSAYTVTGLGCRLGGRSVLREVDLLVDYGRLLVLVGPNGAGKSTLLGALSGDVPAETGQVALDGRVLSTWSTGELARHRSVLLQHNTLSFPFRVSEVVTMGRSPWLDCAEEDEDRAAVEAAVRTADVAHLLDRPFTALSGGERARVSLARVLAQQTPVVLLDEPTAALDLRHQETVMGAAQALARAGRAVVVVLHDLSLAAAHADRIAVLDDGRLVACGAPYDVLRPDLLEATYRTPVHVLTDPGGRLVVVPRRDPLPQSVPFPAPSAHTQR